MHELDIGCTCAELSSKKVNTIKYQQMQTKSKATSKTAVTFELILSVEQIKTNNSKSLSSVI